MSFLIILVFEKLFLKSLINNFGIILFMRKHFFNILIHLFIFFFSYTYIGPLASVDSVNLGFLRCVNESGPADYPDYEIYFNELGGSFATDLGLKPEVLFSCFFDISPSFLN